MRVGTKVVALASAAVLAAGVGVAAWWVAILPGQRAAQLGDAVAASFASGVADDALFTEPAAERLTAIYAGMGELRPSVTVAELAPLDDGTMAAHLRWEWEIHTGKPAWAYETTIALRRADGPDWRAEFTPAAVSPALGEGEWLRASRLPTVRGAVYGQGGVPIAWNQRAYRIGIDKTLTVPATAGEVAPKLAELMGIDVARFTEQVARSGPRAFVEARVLRADLPADAALADEALRWEGVRAIETTRPLAISSSFLRPVLGVVAEATAEQVQASGGTIRGGDLVGRGGLQERRQHVLGGTTGFVVEKVLADRRGVELFKVPALDGDAVLTTIDVVAQQRAEAVLADVGPASALVVLRPSDGAVLAAASGPGSEGYSTATLGQYPPGSTFKIVTALAMLRSGLTPDSTVTCTDGFSVDGYRFDNWQGYPVAALGEVPLRLAFAHSCNSTFLAGAQAVGPEALADAAASLGLTADPALVVGGFLGAVPTDGTSVEKAAAGMGQGKVIASPLGMATVTASVAAGRTMSPVLVIEPGNRVFTPPTPLTETEASALRDLMRGVVTQGTASGLSRLGSGIGAKTGTATWGTASYHGWVVVTLDDLAVCVFIADAAGSSEAVDLAARFLR